MSLNIVSLNVRGIRDDVKRRAIVNYYCQRANILCLQETHSDPESIKKWEMEWNGSILVSHGTSAARGVCIMLKNDLPYRVCKTVQDEAGRAVACELENMDDPSKRVTICNIYGPNKDNPQFFVDVIKLVSELSAEIIIIGDFNVVMNVQMDRKGTVNYSHDHKNCREIINEIMEEMLLTEIWRCRNESTHIYSWMRAKPQYSASRLDYALISQGISEAVDTTMYLPGIKSDHMAFFLSINITGQARGKGYWKFNTRLLYEKEYLECMNTLLERECETSKHMNSIERWLYLKKAAKQETQEYARKRASDRELIISQLSEKIIEIEHEIGQKFDENRYDLLCKSKSEIDELLEEKSRGVMFRTKCRWYEQGEVGSKYFFNMEKRRYTARVCNSIITENGTTINDPKDIIKEQERFYTELYRADTEISFDIVNKSDIRVPVEYNNEDPFTKEEIATALKSLNSGKTPGEDGWSPEFFKVFYKFLGDPMYQMITAVFEERILPEQMRTGIINLIPKASKDSRYLKSLRPITLLSCDYKCIEKAIANRIEPALGSIISNDQRGFMKNRRISINIRKLFDLMQWTEQQNMPAMILSLDFMKCFDKIEKDAIIGSMRYFGFNDFLIRCVETIYCEFKAKIQNNGNFSRKFAIEKGVHQGGPASNVLFSICAELLSIELKNNPDIKGIPVEEMCNLLGQFADDMDMYLLYEEKTLVTVLEVLDWFQKNTGFSVNYDKTQIYRIGSLKNSHDKLISQKNLKWTNEPINVLGINIARSNDQQLKLNYSPICVKVRNIFKRWARRRLSLFGKIKIVNTLVASLFVYKMMVLPNMKEDVIKGIEKEIEKFIWNNHKPKVTMRLLQKGIKSGGAKLVNLREKERALKATWIKTLHENQDYAALVYKVCGLQMREEFWKCNIDNQDIDQIFGKLDDKFWRDVAEAWFSIPDHPTKDPRIIWYNSEIKIAGKLVFWEEAYTRGLKYVQQLYVNGKLKAYQQLNDQFGLSLMRCNSLISAIPVRLRKDVESQVEREMVYPTSRAIYHLMIEDRSSLFVKCDAWANELGVEMDFELFVRGFRDLYVVTNVPKYRSFQYRLLLRALVTNIHMKHWKLIESDQCSFCNKDRETYVHIFVMCEQVRELWIDVERVMEKIPGGRQINFRVDTVLWNRLVLENPADVKNFICLLTKQYIYRQRCLKKQICKYEFRQIVQNVRNMEKYIAIKNGKIGKHERKWRSERSLND